jgi:hypothetical protein
MPPDTEDPITSRIRARLIARHGRDHPMLDAWTRRARELYEGSETPEVRAVVDRMPPLTEDQRRRLALLLAPTHPNTDRAASA